MQYRLFQNPKRDIALLVTVFVVAFAAVTITPKLIAVFQAFQQRTHIADTIEVELSPEERAAAEHEIDELQKLLRSKDEQAKEINHIKLGTAYQQLGRLADAEKSYRRALEINGSQLTTILRLGDVRMLRGDLADAEVWYRRAVELLPSDPLHYEKLVTLYDHYLDDREGARGIYIEALMRTENDPEIMRTFARYLEKIGETYEAYLYWNFLSEKDPKDQNARERADTLRPLVEDTIKETEKKK